MTEESIIQQLKNKEAQLLHELDKVRLALQSFITENMKFGQANVLQNTAERQVPSIYTTDLTYAGKILFILSREDKPMLVDNIAKAIHEMEPEINFEKLHKNVSYNLSMLSKYSRIKKHPFNRRIKYSL